MSAQKTTTISALEEGRRGGMEQTEKKGGKEREEEFDIDIGDRHTYVPLGSYLTEASLGPVRRRCVV
jgi:hypothetical protein